MSLKRQGLIIALITLLLDQASKIWVLYGLDLPALGSVAVFPFLSFSMVWNAGISMGIPLGELFGGADAGRLGLIALTVVISLYLLRWLLRVVTRYEMVGVSLVLGGAVGNVIDRIAYGAVADFIHLHAFGYSFYVFNVADAGITLGVIALIVDNLTATLRARAERPT